MKENSDTHSQPAQAETYVVPLEYAGKWIAWNREQTGIVASGRTLQEAMDAAAAAGEKESLFGKAPKANVRFAGLRR